VGLGDGGGVGSTAGAGGGASGVGRGDEGVNDRRGGVPLGEGVARGRGDEAGTRPGMAVVRSAPSGTAEGGAATGDAAGVVRDGPAWLVAADGDADGSAVGAMPAVGAPLTRRMMMAATRAAANMLASQA